jgi:hypothetical protein
MFSWESFYGIGVIKIKHLGGTGKFKAVPTYILFMKVDFSDF